jgi:hypothetical protein
MSEDLNFNFARLFAEKHAGRKPAFVFLGTYPGLTESYIKNDTKNEEDGDVRVLVQVMTGTTGGEAPEFLDSDILLNPTTYDVLAALEYINDNNPDGGYGECIPIEVYNEQGKTFFKLLLLARVSSG